MSTLYRHLIIALEALGTSADAVADSLLGGGWTGLRQDALCCPVSNYVVAVVPGAELAAVTRNRITVISTEGEPCDATLPAGPAAFVSAFDAGAYDELAAVLTRSDGEVIDDLER
ncbi:hypothetical protein [Dactylosporangium sp. CS-033363]|uniref:hypothetical protein n=1 Tax=Dactylosporangium sp. CS-033363 TaxID=3239935 RepID=UPI003D8BA3D3